LGIRWGFFFSEISSHLVVQVSDNRKIRQLKLGESFGTWYVHREVVVTYNTFH